MQALQLFGDRDLRLIDVEGPPPPGPGEVRVRVRAVGLNFIDVWGFRGMAFAKRRLPLTVGAEAAGEIAELGAGVEGLRTGDKVALYGAMTCGKCRACAEGRDNLCEDVGGVMGFHIDGFAREFVTMPARLVVKVPDAVSLTDAACAGIAFGTVQHMLFDNAKLEPGESILVHAGGSGIGTAAIRMAKAIGCTVYTTVGDDEKGAKAAALGADHVVNYRTERFEGEVRRLTKRKGVDVVFEHVGPDTLERFAALPQARRPAHDLRLDLRRLDHDEPDAAVPAAIPHHRLVRLPARQHRAVARQDGRRHPPRRRHGLSPRGLRAGARNGSNRARSSARSW